MALTTLAVLAALALSSVQSVIASRSGSDHPAHAFLRDGIRANGGRLFITVPRLLNEAHCAAMPLYLHWILARLPESVIRWSERMLNPMINAAHALLLAILASAALGAHGTNHINAGHVALLFALTPQLFHALSARNFGLSARGVGLLLLTAFFGVSHLASLDGQPSPWWVALTVLGWLIWGFSTFAQQALVMISLLLLAVGIWQPALGALLGLAVFVAVHPVYARSYLKHTARFLLSYARELAPIYVLQRRPSIWRDLVWDLWRKPREAGSKRAFLYAYENSVLVVVMLNPATVFTAWVWVTSPGGSGWLPFAGAVAVAGLAATLLTSLRPTRFLGEPERYAEVVAPWASLYAANALAVHLGTTAVWLPIVVFALLNCGQLMASWLLMRHVRVTNDELEQVARIADQSMPESIRFCCNNEQLTKLLMTRPWQFAYFIAVGQDYAGMSATQAFSRFPLLKPEACGRVARTYRINCLLLDNMGFEQVFETRPSDLRAVRSLYRSSRFHLLHLDWQEPSGDVPAPVPVWALASSSS